MKTTKKAPDPKRAVAYLRTSTDRQDLSPDAQRAAIAAWAAREGVTVLAEYVDEDVSGGDSLADCPGLLDAIAALPTHGAGSLVVAKRDRAGREPLRIAMLEAACKRHRAQLVSAAGEGNGDDPVSVLMRRIVDAFAEYERLVIKQRTRAAMRVKIARGESTGTPPYGYRVAEGVRTPDGRRYAVPPTLQPDKAEQLVIERIVNMRSEGYTAREIIEALVAQGIPSRTGVWHMTTIYRILRDRSPERKAS